MCIVIFSGEFNMVCKVWGRYLIVFNRVSSFEFVIF